MPKPGAWMEPVPVTEKEGACGEPVWRCPGDSQPWHGGTQDLGTKAPGSSSQPASQPAQLSARAHTLLPMLALRCNPEAPHPTAPHDATPIESPLTRSSANPRPHHIARAGLLRFGVREKACGGESPKWWMMRPMWVPRWHPQNLAPLHQPAAGPRGWGGGRLGELGWGGVGWGSPRRRHPPDVM